MLLWSLARRRWLVVVGFAASMAVLVRLSFLLLPSWLGDFLRQVANYPPYTEPGASPVWVIVQSYLGLDEVSLVDKHVHHVMFLLQPIELALTFVAWPVIGTESLRLSHIRKRRHNELSQRAIHLVSPVAQHACGVVRIAIHYVLSSALLGWSPL